ncbi:hypothetical protein KCP77_19870 [Salmonella enterica subsp. enterica]|nr:hypothetical protein KCP77_19870 [Salmonella enterica subsp. enterica]
MPEIISGNNARDYLLNCWYFRREWRRYLARWPVYAYWRCFSWIPPKVVGIVVDGVTAQHFTRAE